MSEETIWTCDRCKRTWRSSRVKNPLQRIVISSGYNHNYSPVHKYWQGDWCQECLVETGVRKPEPLPEATPSEPTRLSLEEIVREIVQEEMDNR